VLDGTCWRGDSARMDAGLTWNPSCVAGIDAGGVGDSVVVGTGAVPVPVEVAENSFPSNESSWASSAI
jgi:hypothetical protein